MPPAFFGEEGEKTEMTNLYLGVYGGGTRTELRVADEEGRELLCLRGGPTSYKAVGNAAAFANMRDLARQMESLGVRPRLLTRGVWGISGCDTPQDQTVYDAMVEQAGFLPERTTVVNNAVLPFWAAAELPGVVVIAGTGSVVMGLDSQGKTKRIGGWNYAFSDLGSGYWMGSRLLREMTLWLDGCREDCFTFRKVEAKLLPQGGSREDMLYRLSTLNKGSEIASYASIVLDTAESPLCKKLRQQAADYLTDQAGRMLEALRAKGEQNLKIVLAGGLVKSEFFRDQAVAAMEAHGVPVIVNTAPPAEGGIKLAKHLG